ncbi:MAG: MFS transporter [Chloroflexi bacterium]|nr:MFS transporter [Chloroflexota bacterium]
MESVGAKRRGLHYGYVVLFSSMLVVLGAIGLGRFAYTVILPSMKVGLSLTYEQSGWLASFSFFGYLALTVIASVIAARFGSRVIVSACLLLAGVGMIGTGLAPDASTALITQTLTGMGSGGSNVPVMALTAAWFASNRRGMASGIASGGSGLGLVISGMVLPAVIVSNGSDGWRYAWYLVGGLATFFAVIAVFLLRDRPSDIGLTPIGETQPLQAPTPTSVNNSSPLASIKLIYGMPVFWHLSFIYFLFGFSYVLYSTFFAAYLTKEGGLSNATAGGLWALVGLISIVSGSIWGAVSDRWGRKYGLAAVFLLQAISYTTFAVFQNMTGFYTSAILFGLTAWSIPAIISAASGDYGGSRLAPAVLGSVTLFFAIGQVLAPFLAGRIADATGSFVLTFLLAAATAAVGSLSSLTLRPLKMRQYEK